MKRKLIFIIMLVCVCVRAPRAYASSVIPDHKGTSMEGVKTGTESLNASVKQYYELFRSAGCQYGVDPNLLAAICMQESSGRNLSYREDGSRYPAWGIMQIEYTLENSFAEFGREQTGTAWTLTDRLDQKKSVDYAAWMMSRFLLDYDCDYMKAIQAYNFSETVLDRIIDAADDGWIAERANAAAYASNWSYPTYGDAEYIEHVMRYYHKAIDYPGVKARFNGRLIDFDNQYPIIISNYTYIPVRAAAEALGADVSWDQSRRTASIMLKDKTISLTADSDRAYLNGEAVSLESKARIINNRTVVPLRFVAEALDFDVYWDEDTRTVYLY